MVISCASEVLSPTEGGVQTLEQLKETPSFLKLKEVLSPLGYEGIGFQYENDETLEYLCQVFKDPRTAHRQIKVIYTGLAFSYDARYQSLTIGSEHNFEKTIQAIVKDVPLRKK